MKQVWKCDYCVETHVDSDVITQHESECVLNPEYKGCFTCEHSYWYYDVRCCTKGLNVNIGEQGNCKGYQTEENEMDSID